MIDLIIVIANKEQTNKQKIEGMYDKQTTTKRQIKRSIKGRGGGIQ